MQVWSKYFWFIIFVAALLMITSKCASASVCQCTDVIQYIETINPKVDATVAAKYLCDAAAKKQLDVWLLVAVAQHESTFRVSVVGGAGERGLIQVHPVHCPCMEKHGLDLDSDYDVVLEGAIMMRERFDNGKSLYATLQPWSVRHDALATYQSMPLATQTGLEALTVPESSEAGVS